MEQVKQRSTYLDIVKGFAILCVILGHCIQFGSGEAFSQTVFERLEFKLIYSFHMPLFMLVSGYLFVFSVEKKSWTTLLLQRVQALLIPILVWSILPWISSLQYAYEHGEALTPYLMIRRYISTTLRNQWFLWAIFWCAVVVILVHQFCKDSVWVYLLGFVACFFIPDVVNTHLYKFLYPFFVVGYLFSKKGCKETWKKLYKNNIVLLLLGLVYIGLMFLYERDTFIYSTGCCIVRNNPGRQLYLDLYRCLIGMLGSAFVLLLWERVYSFLGKKVTAALVFLGQHTMGLYLFSGVIFNYLIGYFTTGLTTINYLLVFAETIVITAISLLCSCLVKKVRILNKLLLGGR